MHFVVFTQSPFLEAMFVVLLNILISPQFIIKKSDLEVKKIKICNATGCGVCYHCDGTPPITNGYSHGDICRKIVQNIMNYLEDGDLYKFSDGKLYRATVDECQFYEEGECQINAIE